jgi:hypothetical protein
MSDIVSVLNNIGYTNLIDSGTHYRTKPLYRDSDSSTVLCIKKATGQWYDHAERIGGSLAQLVQRTLNLPSTSDVRGYIGDLQSSIEKSNHVIELTEIKKFDKELLVKLIKDNSYWNSRGISDFTLKSLCGGVAQNGRMKDRYVFPIFDERHDIIGFAGRLLKKDNFLPKWKILGQKKNFLFPTSASTEIMSSKSVILVESIGDCLKLMECGINNVLVLFGVSISPKIIQYLLRLDVNKIIISLNNDSNNNFVGNKAAEECKVELSNYFDENQLLVALPTSKDFGEMPCEEILSWKNQYLN